MISDAHKQTQWILKGRSCRLFHGHRELKLDCKIGTVADAMFWQKLTRHFSPKETLPSAKEHQHCPGWLDWQMLASLVQRDDDEAKVKGFKSFGAVPSVYATNVPSLLWSLLVAFRLCCFGICCRKYTVIKDDQTIDNFIQEYSRQLNFKFI